MARMEDKSIIKSFKEWSGGMGYKYITGNNLYEKQTYMYSEYKGMEFIKEYLESRKSCMEELEETSGGHAGGPDVAMHSNVLEDLSRLREELQSGNGGDWLIKSVNAYTKSFEVRKRIYTEYDDDWKPSSSAGFEEYESYLVFAECLLLSYYRTKCLKYFSCLLKLDDSLISIHDRMGRQSKRQFLRILEQELDIFSRLASANGISEGAS